MKFKQFINENINPDLLAKILTKECQPFFKELKSHFKRTDEPPFFRMTRMNINNGYKIITPRTDRKPLDTPQIIHDLLNKEFKSKFGWNVRSEGVFTLSRVEAYDIKLYGSDYVFFPFGNYRYVYSREIDDLTVHLSDMGIIRQKSNDYNYIKGGNYDMSKYVGKEDLEGDIQDIISTYKNNDLRGMIGSTNEVIFKCDKYIIITPTVFDMITKTDVYNNFIEGL